MSVVAQFPMLILLLFKSISYNKYLFWKMTGLGLFELYVE